MKFVDHAEIEVSAGKGGKGGLAFRREKFVPKGGPSGGDGGAGGDVAVEVDTNLHTLMDYRYRRELRAKDGQPGGPNRRTGADGDDAVLRVPAGTIVRDAESGELLVDACEPGRRDVIAGGGRGGRGNARFATPTRRTPRFSESGKDGQCRQIILELKVVADAGLVGLPNAGKSTLLARLSSATPRIADYPFTTLTPNLGIVKVESWRSFVLADIPGLIEDAHKGKGLGHEFLRHVERCRVLVMVVDVASEDPKTDLQVVERELAEYGARLDRKPRIYAINKVDLGPPPDDFMEWIDGLDGVAFTVSGVSGRNLDRLAQQVMEELDALRDSETDEAP